MDFYCLHRVEGRLERVKTTSHGWGRLQVGAHGSPRVSKPCLGGQPRERLWFSRWQSSLRVCL